jgi:hypothetical protein
MSSEAGKRTWDIDPIEGTKDGLSPHSFDPLQTILSLKLMLRKGDADRIISISQPMLQEDKAPGLPYT